MVGLRTLGGLALLRDGIDLGGFSAQRLRCALLTYLAVEGSTDRDQLISLFWPDREPERARHALSQILYEIRRDFGDDLIEVRGGRVAAANLEVDVRDFERAVERHDVERAVVLYHGAFLGAFHLPDNAEFEHWVDAQRARLQRLHRRSQRELIGARSEAGDLSGALAAARRWAAVEPLEDEAHHRLIELLAVTGERSSALLEYEAYRDRVRRELQVDPIPETQQLVVHIRDGSFESGRLPSLADDATSLSTPAASDSGTDQGVGPPRSPNEGGSRGRRWPWLIGGAVVVAAAAATAWLVTPRDICPNGGPPPCTQTPSGSWSFLVLPFDGGTDASVDGSLAARLLARSLHSWRGAYPIEFLRVQDALARENLSSGAIRLNDGLRLAAVLRADRLIMGEVIEVADSLMISATLYTVEGDEAPRTARISLHRSAPDVTAFDTLTAALLLGEASRLAAGAGAPLSKSLQALLAYQAGEDALARWDLDEAGQRFAEAARGDSTFALAYLRLAEVLAWVGDTAAVWRAAATRAALLSDRLSPGENALARGFRALAERRYPDACEAFRQALAQDSLSFVAWYGLGDCNVWDPIVVADTASPTGWAFRASYHTAVESYRRALEIVPSFNFAFRSTAYARLTRLIRTDADAPLYGTLSDQTAEFAAAPFLDDTIGFWPAPFEQFASGRETGAMHATWQAALEHNRRQLRRIVQAWVNAFPKSPAAIEALARTLEASGAIGDADRPSALTMTRDALKLHTDPADRLRLRVMEARLLVKRGEYATARRLAVSLLAERPEVIDAEAAELLSGVAALTGRPHTAADLWATPAPELAAAFSDDLGFATSTELHRALLRVQVYAEFDAFRDSTRAIWDRITTDVYERRRLPDVRDAHMKLLDVPASVAFRHVGATKRHDVSDFILIRLQRAIVRNDGAAARSVMEEDARFRRTLSPADFSPYLTREQVLGYLILRDTTTALRLLDDALASIPALEPHMWTAVDAAALLQMMMLRADLAAANGARRIAARWARPVVELWAESVPALRPDVERMRRLL